MPEARIKKSCILFYSPFDLRSRDTESLMIAFCRQGFRVISLSQEKGSVIHEYLKGTGVETYTHIIEGKKGLLYFVRHIFFLIRFCSKNDVDVVYSHLEAPSFVATVAQYFVKARVYVCRHHVDEAALYHFDRSMTYRLTYMLAKRIIVVSNRALEYMVKYEKVPRRKIIHINLAYDFSLYQRPEPKAVDVIRQEYPCEILLVAACRLTRYKRPDVAIHSLIAMLSQGLDVKLIILGHGEEEATLHSLISQYQLQSRVSLPGYVSNMPDYLAAADFLIHPSILESSCVAVKEAGLVKTPVIVCGGVGDFDDYIRNGINGYLLDADNFASQATDIVQQYSEGKERFADIGENLYVSVIKLFSIENVIDYYKALNNVNSK